MYDILFLVWIILNYSIFLICYFKNPLKDKISASFVFSSLVVGFFCIPLILIYNRMKVIKNDKFDCR